MLLSELGGERQPPEDLNMKLVNTYVLCRRNGGDPGAVLITGIGHDFITGVAKSSGIREAWSCPWEQFDLLKPVPDSGVYQITDTSVAIVRRLAKRQNQDGCTPDTVSMLINGEKEVPKFTLELMNKIYSDQPDIPLTAARRKVRDGGSVRLNRNYWVSRKGSTISLFRNNTRLGSWAMGRFFYSQGARILEQELADELGYK
jgi:hypothetical protein